MSIIGDFFNRITNKRLPDATISEEPRGQYTFEQIRDIMNENGGMEEFFQELDKINENQDKYYPSRIHGIEHTSRVTFLATILAKMDALDEHTKKLLITAARLHDIGRIDDRESKEHGAYGKEKIEQEGLLDEFSSSDRKIIEFVIEQHSLSREENEKAIAKLPFWQRKEYQVVLNYLKDADALDRVRIANESAQLDPSRLRSRTAKELVSFSYQNFQYGFKKVLVERQIQRLSDSDEELKGIINFARRFLNAQWITENIDFLKNCHNRGILQDMERTGASFLDYVDNQELVDRTSNEILAGDFEFLRKSGYNITYESFLQVVSQYKEGTLNLLRNSGKLDQLFSYETFKKYGREQSFEDRISRGEEISRDELFKLVNKGKITLLTEETFDSQYLLYKNMYTNNKNAFDMYMYSELDVNAAVISGILENVQINDLNILKEKGYNISLSNLIILASRFTPEEYRNIIDSDNAEKLFSYIPEKDAIGRDFERVWQRISSVKHDVSREELARNYVLYKEISTVADKIYAIPELRGYSIEEIYPAFIKMQEAEFKLNTFKGRNVSFTAKSLLDLIEFSNKTKILESANEEEKEQVIALLVQNGEWKNDPRLIEYVTKKNKVYTIKEPSDILDYNKFCMEQILINNDISLEEARQNLINSLVNIDCPKGEYKRELEENILDELYFYKKYKQEGKIGEQGKEPSEVDVAIDTLLEIMDSNDIKEFKDKLFAVHKTLGNFNLDAIIKETKEALRGLAKQDLIEELNKTRDMLDKTESTIITYEGEDIPIKNLQGQEFMLAMTTSMPNCSSISREGMGMDKDKIRDNMLNRPLNLNNRCTSIISNTMIAHAMSAIQDEELKYAYVPKYASQVSLQGKHDLSTVKKIDENGLEQRKTDRATQSRTAKDLVATTTEEHNETVLNGVYPRYVICFDRISEVAIQKYQMLKHLYLQQGINQKIEILLVDGKDKYIPQIEENLENSFSEITREIQETGSMSAETIDRFFNNRENNLALQTVQAINCTSYRDELWSPERNAEKLGRLTEVLELAVGAMPKEQLSKVTEQLDFLLDRKDKDSINGQRFYDHCWAKSMDAQRLEGLKERITDRIEGREQVPKTSALAVEEISVGENQEMPRRADEEVEY